MAYAKRFTKEELIKSGIEIKIEDDHLKIYRNGNECKLHKTPDYYINPKIYCNKKRKVVPYFVIAVYNTDERGNRIKYYYKSNKWTYKTAFITLQRAVWAWYNGEVPAGMIVDHVNNKHNELDDYLPNNLQLLTPKENINKDSKQNKNRLLKCSLKKPLSYFETKLAKASELYNNSTGLERHKHVKDCARYKANIRYWKLHNKTED